MGCNIIKYIFVVKKCDENCFRIQIVDQHNTSYRKVQYIRETKVSMKTIVPVLTSSTLYSIKVTNIDKSSLSIILTNGLAKSKRGMFNIQFVFW